MPKYVATIQRQETYSFEFESENDMQAELTAKHMVNDTKRDIRCDEEREIVWVNRKVDLAAIKAN